jgi:DnaD/phage-associated family protein
MAAKYWLKLYYEMLDDPKIGKLSPVLRWRFIECLLVAGETDEGGLLPDVNEMAWRVRESGERYETELNELTNVGLLSRVDGRYLVTNFSNRQQAVSGAERVARYRERQKKQGYYGDETMEKRNDNADVTKRYTDTDTDTDKITDIDKNQNVGGGDFAAVVSVYENNIGGLTSVVSELIEEALATYPTDWIIDAIGIAVKNNSRRWSYAEGVLKRWQSNGRGYSPRTSTNGQTLDDIIKSAFQDDSTGR